MDMHQTTSSNQNVKQPARVFLALRHLALIATGSMLFAVPHFAASSMYATASFGLGGFVPHLAVLIVFALVAISPGALQGHLAGTRRNTYLRILLVAAVLCVVAWEVSFSRIRMTPTWGAGYYGRIYAAETVLIAVAFMLWGTALTRFPWPVDAETSTPQPSSRTTTAWHLVLVMFMLGGISLACAGICIKTLFPTPCPASGEVATFLIRLACGALLAGAVAIARLSGRFALSPFMAALIGEAAVMLASYLVERRLVPLMASSSGSILVSLLLPVLCCAGATFAARRSYATVLHENEKKSDSFGALASLPGAGNLSQREIDVIGHTLAGQTQKQIAAHLNIAPATVATYRTRAYRKLGVTSRKELMTRLQPCDAQVHELGIDTRTAAQHPTVINLQRNCGRMFLLPPLFAYLTAAALLTPLRQPYRMALAMGACLVLAIFALARASRTTSSKESDDSRRRTVCQLLAVSAALGSTRFLISSANPFDGNAGGQIVLVALCMLGVLMGADRMLTLRQLTDSGQRSSATPNRYAERMRHILAGKGFGAPSIDILMESLQGSPTASIAKQHHLSASSIASYRAHAYSVLGVSGITELNRYLLREIGVEDGKTETT